MSAKLPARCECGWIFPAAFQVFTPPPKTGGAEDDMYPRLGDGAVLLFACGSCGVWLPCALSARGGAHTVNAAGFANLGKVPT
jgi:hypothetical protein